MKKVHFLYIVACLLSLDLTAQFDFSYHEMKNKYSKYNAVIIEKTEDVVIDIVKDSLVASQHNAEKILILTENGRRYANDRVYKHSFTRVSDIDARTYVPKKNGKYSSEKVADYKIIDDMSSYVFYDDSKAITFTFPALQEGAVTSLEYDIKFSDTRFLRSFFFKSYLPVLKTSLTIKVNKNIELEFKNFHLDGTPYTFTESEKGNYKIYKWEAQNLEEFKTGGDRIGITHYSPHIVYYIGSVDVNGLKRKQYGSVEDLYRFYYSYIQNVDTSCNDGLHKKVNEIVAGIDDEEEKVKKILTWVRSNIKYIAFEQGMRGFIPDHGCDVYNKKYGDCKDMATLIVTMLNCAGVKAQLAWTGTRHIPYSYEELPLPKTDNHMIAIYMKNDTPIILDGTITHLTYGYPPYLLQDKEILVSFSEDKYKVYKVPVMPAPKSVKNSGYSIQISGDSITGSGKTTYFGYNRSEINYALSGVKEKDIRKSLLRILSVGSNKFNITGHNVKVPADEEIPVAINYGFNVPGYVRSIDNEIYLNLNIDKSYGNFKLDTAITDVPIENDFYFHENYKTAIDVPLGYLVGYLPENKKFENDRFGFDITYKMEGAAVLQEKNIYFKFLVLRRDEFDTWNKMIADLVEAYRESIVFEKKM